MRSKGESGMMEGAQSCQWKQEPDLDASATRTGTPDHRWRVAARLVSLLSNPMVLSLPCFAAVCWKAAPTWGERVRWWGISSLAMTLTPFVHVRWGVRSGRLSDHDVSVRQERFWPYMSELGAIGCSYLLMRGLGAPRLMTAMVLSVGVGITAVTGVTLFWKINMHVTGASGTCMLLVLVYGKGCLPVFLLVPAVGWSRYMLEHHTAAQAADGAVIGALAPLVVFRAMRLTSYFSREDLSKVTIERFSRITFANRICTLWQRESNRIGIPNWCIPIQWCTNSQSC